MAINPYEPELAKRSKTLEIAHSQLSQEMNRLRTHKAEGYRQQMKKVDEALKDYRDAGYSFAEWIEQKPAES